MQRLNAVDAITPAWKHTQKLLFAPQNWRLAFKIGAVAFFAQMGGCNSSFNINTPAGNPHGLPHAVSAALLAVGLIIGIVALVVGLIFFYLGSRLQFVLFEVVLRRETRIAPIWRRYGRATWYWIGLKLAFFAIAFLCLSPILVPAILTFVRATQAGPDAINQHLVAFVGSMLGFVGVIFLALFILGLGYSLLADFGLPSMALESTSLEETVRRVIRLVRAEPGQVAIFLLLRFLLALAGGIAFYICLGIATIMLLIPLGGAGAGLWLTLRHAGLAGHVVMIAGGVVLGGILVAILLMAAILLFGCLFTFLQAYALYFLGGRYPLLGSLLDPDPSAPFTPPPSFPSPEERKDDDGGPPLPMDPVIA